MPNKIRIDKWLWSVRIYKTRTMATDACRSGKVKIGDDKVKPSFSLEEGMLVTAVKKEKKWVVKVLKLIEKRVSAQSAVECYEDLSPPVELKGLPESAFYGVWESRDRGAGRPTKKERRLMEKFKNKK